MRLFILVFCFWCLASDCLGDEIKLYSGKFPNQCGQSFNFIFSPLDYLDNKVFLKDLTLLVQRFRTTVPFSEFNNYCFWYIDISKQEEKNFKQDFSFPPVKVRKDFLDEIFRQVESPYKLIIVDSLGSISCAELSSEGKISLIVLGKRRYNDENSFANGFLHELGHSFGLRDECVDCNSLCSAGPPNCVATKNDAEKLWGDLVGKENSVNYIRGCCGNRSFIRPTVSSLMNDADKAEDFGPVNERYLRNILKGH